MCKKLIHLTSFLLVLGLLLTSGARADLVGWWRLEEGSGTTVSDSSASGNDGTFVGSPEWVAGRVGGALEFDGGDYVNVPGVANITPESITLMTWVNFSTVDPAAMQRQDYLSRGDDYAFSLHEWGARDGTAAEGKISGIVTSAGGWTVIGGNTDVEADIWYHTALTYDAGTDMLTLYLDGEVDGELTVTTGLEHRLGGPLTIGTFSGRDLLGKLDEIKIYDEALSQAEIRSAMTGEGWPYALSPSPANGALYPDIWVSLTWKAGDFAVSHNVYMGEDFDDVNEGTGDTFLDNVPENNVNDPYLIVGFFGYPFPEGLVPGTTYYWRVDEVNDMDPNSPWKGDVWSFMVPPKKAYEPVPGDGARFVDTDVTLTWTPGYLASMHTVYFGDDFDTVNNATGGTGQPLTTYTPPGPLDMDKTYYWRVDEFETPTTPAHTGDVWSFTTTLPGLGTIVHERWDNFTGSVAELRSSPRFPNNPDVVETLTQFSWNGPDTDNYGARIYGWVYAPATGDHTFWLTSDDNGELWLSTDDDSSNVELIAVESSWRDLNSWGIGGEEESEPIPLVAGNRYYIEALWQEGNGGDHCQVAWQGPGVPTITIIPGTNLSPYEPMTAFGAKPTNRATGVTQTPILEWKPGMQAASHEVYFGTDEDAVRNATKTSSEFKSTRALGDESYDPGELAWETTYYWRIDEVNNLNPDSPWVGSVLSFTTADYAIVDEFEDYDTDNAIWANWTDGLGFIDDQGVTHPGNGSGSEVGDPDTPSYTEESIVHGGGQSMPYWYNNSGSTGKFNYSEAKKTLSDTRDWTEGGVKALSLWFQGYPASVGSFVESPPGTYTMTGSGADIWNTSDEFHFAYKMLTGPGSIVAKVESIQDTQASAKAGVMIRETLEADSKYAIVAVTPGSGVIFEYRADTGIASEQSASQTGITAPYWVKLDRDLAGNFTASHSINGSTWEALGVSENIQMGSNIYIGLPLTSHNAALTCEAVLSNVTTTVNVSGQWQHQDIGIQSNDPEPMYVAVANSTGAPAVVYHDDPSAAQMDTWTEWNIDLKEFQDKGINLTDVDSVALGFGDRNNPQVGGSGKMYFDDFRLYRPRCVPDEVTLSQADLNSDCVVDYRDLEIMVGDWLAGDPGLAGDLNADDTVDFKDYAVLADQWLEEQVWP